MTLTRFISMAIGILISSPALSLSCSPYSPVHAYLETSAAKETYVIVHGVLTFDVNLAHGKTPPAARLPAHIKGYALGDDGFTIPFDNPVTLFIQCFGPWCGGARNDAPYLAFLQKTNSGYLLEENPCFGRGFYPNDQTLQEILTCHKGGPCAPLAPY